MVLAQTTAPSGSTASMEKHPHLRLVDRVVVPVQGTDREFYVQQWAVEFAKQFGVPVLALHVENPASQAPSDVFSYIQAEARKWDVILETSVHPGDDVAKALLTELGPRDLVVLGTRRFKSRYRAGSVGAQLVEQAPCPIQLIRLDN